MNHIVDECYWKHRFPSWMKQKRNHNANVIENVEEQVATKDKSSQDQFINNQIMSALFTLFNLLITNKTLLIAWLMSLLYNLLER